jgi:hypothetical protein
LLPPKWEPASVAKKSKKAGPSGSNMTAAINVKNLKLSDSVVNTRTADGSPQPKKGLFNGSFHILKNAPGITVSLTDSIKPRDHVGYMESDDPTHISNVRRSLIQERFPNSEFAQASTAQIKGDLTGANLERTLSEEEEQNQSQPHLLDETANVPPSAAVPDSPTPGYLDEEEESGSRPNNNRRTTTDENLHRFKNRFHRQRPKTIKRHLDHSEFTSEEDLPYQGDSDLSLPLEILFRVALFINQAKAANKIESTLVSVTISSIDILVNSLTAFERIVHTPIPKAYNIHL